MVRLIRNELVKVFHKKGIFIIWGIMVIFCLLNNILYQVDYDEEGIYKYQNSENIEEEIDQLELELRKYDHQNVNDVSMYITLKTKLDILELKKEFDVGSWQYEKLEEYMYDILYQRNVYTYQEQNDFLLEEVNSNYQQIYCHLKENHWKYFLKLEKEQLQEQILLLKENLEVVRDELKRLEYTKRLEELEDELKILDYRIDKGIMYDDGYLNQALVSYQGNIKKIKYYEGLNREFSFEENTFYREAIASSKVSEYMIRNQVNVNQENTLNYQLRTIVEDYELFFVVLILMVSSILICDEFRTGTIKLLLIKPYSRCKILLSKYFTSMIVMLISILFLISIQLLIGGVIFGMDSLSMPVVTYSFHSKTLVSYSVFQYMGIRILAKLPFLLMLSFIGICFGVLFTNTAITIIVPFLFYLFAPTIQTLAIEHHLWFLKFWISMNWNFQDYLFGGISKFPYGNLSFSIFVWCLYLIGIIILTGISFQKKNIKNI